MDNQHKKIKGYRDLSQEEIDLMNEIKGKGEELGELFTKLEQVFDRSEDASPLSEAQAFQRQQCISQSEVNLKQGIMWLVRSVALPESF